MTAAAPFALLFDLDGTLVDTDALHLAAWNGVLAGEGLPPLGIEAYRARVMGFDADAVTGALFPGRPLGERRALTAAKEAAFRAAVSGEGARLDPLPGAVALLDRADAAGVPKAVVTNAPRGNAGLVLRALGLADRFDALVIGGELARAKPDPLPYATGLALLGATADRALAFEDSAAGARSASAAGIETVGLLTSLDAAALRAAGAAHVARDYDDPALRALVEARLLAAAGGGP